MDMLNIKNFSQYKSSVIAFLIVAVFVLINLNTFSRHSVEMGELESEVEKLEDGEKTIKKWLAVRAGYKKLNKVFLTDDTMTLKQFIREKAKLFNTDIRSLKASYEKKDEYLEAPIDLRIVGFYGDFVDFIKAIEEKTIEINRFKITRKKGSEVIDIDLSLRGLIIE
tara:strand:- start:166 stop:666 length:501 start_codon:yes stop_codon:yes gene_type:complete